MMHNILLKAAVDTQLAINRGTDKVLRRKEDGGIAEQLLIIAVLVLIVVTVGKILYDNIVGQANNVGDCISSANSIGNGCSKFSKE